MKKRFIHTLIIVILISSILAFSYSIINIIKWNIANQKTKGKIEEINELVNIEETSDSSNTEIITNDDIEKNDPYWDYIKEDLINVDFQNLKEINSGVKGWIQVKGTNINYPFVQAKDNSYYLHHSFDKSYNEAGWVFMDHRNKNFSDRNTIIYGHNRHDKTMFGSLKQTLNNDWLKNKENFIIKISTETENTLWQVFSIYHIKTTSDYLVTNFTNEEFDAFIQMLIKRSIYNFNTKVNNTDRILTLSSCYGKSEKIAVHAKLIKIEKK